MKVINLKQPLNTLSGLPLKDGAELVTIGKVVANILLASEAGGKMKLYALAQRCYGDDSVELDTADFGMVTREIENTKAYTVLVTGQLLSILSDIKEQSK